jgi:hypothetical protein
VGIAGLEQCVLRSGGTVGGCNKELAVVGEKTVEAGSAKSLASCFEQIGIFLSGAVGNGGNVIEEIVAIPDGSIGEKGAAVLPKCVVAIGNVVEGKGKTKLLLVNGVIAKTNFG